MKINNLETLKEVLFSRYSELSEINPKYLSEAGNAAKEAFQSAFWHTCFHDDIKSLSEDEDFKGLVAISNKHPEYYNIIRMINRSVEKAVKGA